MKLQDLVDGVRFTYNNASYEYRKDQQEYDGSIWLISMDINPGYPYRRPCDLVHLITPSGFDLVRMKETWAFSRMRKCGFEYRIHNVKGKPITQVTALNDADFRKQLKTLLLPISIGPFIRVTSRCPGSGYPKSLDTSILKIKKQQP